ncbi:hypothetical protein JTB14_010186 [Gonioctena quinquepunctata]|nr:hypothetical protein JTB14_010186 [Gonioctena quinquepunctata]
MDREYSANMFCTIFNMCIPTKQKIIIYVLFCEMLFKVESRLIKRSPLELGFVTFPEIEKPKRPILFNKTKPEMKFEESGPDLSLPVSSRITHTHEWIPGRIKHHAYLPAHIHHIFIPVLIHVNPPVHLGYDLYPKHYGGFGIGTYSGGQGTGHGYQIVFNH